MVYKKLSFDLFSETKFMLNLFSVFFCLLIGFFFGSCGSSGVKSKYTYLTDEQQRVLELCVLVFSDPYYQYISPSRRVKLKKFRTTDWGFWATFEDGRTYRVPIVSELQLGKDYYCNFRSYSTYCSYTDDFENRCEWD